MKHFKFKGWDWTEVLEALEDRKALAQDDDKCKEQLGKILDKATLDVVSGAGHEEHKISPRTREVLNACRAYTKKIASLKDGYDWTVFEGISRIKRGDGGDETFLKYFRDFFTYMWT